MKTPIALFVLAGVAAQASQGVTSPSARPAPTVLESVRAHRKGLAVWWVGNAGWLIKSDDLLIGVDLELGLGQRV